MSDTKPTALTHDLIQRANGIRAALDAMQSFGDVVVPYINWLRMREEYRSVYSALYDAWKQTEDYKCWGEEDAAKWREDQ